MGIELPTPSLNSGEAPVAPQNNGERTGLPFGVERQVSGQSAEIFTSERPAPQETRTGQGVGDAFSAPAQTGVSNATDDTSAQPLIPSIPSLDDIPVVAADEDLIEKQWVDSTKKIIKDTRSDPYRQSEAISRLQADYLQKRYGKTLADSGA